METDTATNFSNLLDEHKVKVFQFLSPENRQLIRSICVQWRDIVNKRFGIKIIVKNSTSDLITLSEDAVDVELVSMTMPFRTNIAFANRLEKLKFSNIVVTYNVIYFLEACTNIKHVSFLNVVVDIPMTDQWNSSGSDVISLTNLETLEILCWTFTESIMELMNFLRERFSFGSLTMISVVVQNPPILPLQLLFSEVPQEDNHALLQLVKSNLRTLRTFSVGRLTAPTIFEFHEYGIFGDENPLQIKRMIISPYFREDWISLFDNQEHLEVMDVGSVNVNRWEHIQEGIIKNCPYLQSFSMKGLSFGQVWDCAIFQNCVVLDKLFIEICHSPKTNLMMVPVQLSHLSLWGPLRVTEIESIAQHLVNLIFLKFSNLGRSSSLVIDETEKIELGTFKALLQLPVLKTLHFNVCSTVSIDWIQITNWCRVNASQELHFDQHFYQMHGEEIPDGISVIMTENFQRSLINWTEDTTDNLSSVRVQPNIGTTVSVGMSSVSLP